MLRRAISAAIENTAQQTWRAQEELHIAAKARARARARRIQCYCAAAAAVLLMLFLLTR